MPTDIVDPDTGEVIQIEEGEDGLRYLANLAIEALDQKKLWESHERRIRGELKERQQEKSAVYGDVKVLFAQNPPKLDKVDFRARVEDMGLEPDELWELVMAAQGFDRDDLSERLANLVSKCMKPSGSHVRVSRVRKFAPEAA